VENITKGVIASDNAICSQLGDKILNVDNGNVIDAAVAVAFCLGVCNPSSSGVGGGMFMLIHIDEDAKDQVVNNRYVPYFKDDRDHKTVDSNGKITLVIDAREVAPQMASRDMFHGMAENASTIGGKSIAVPGELKGLELAHAMFGKLSWEHVITPSIEMARSGVRVSRNLADEISRHLGERWNFPDLRKILSKNGQGLEPLEEGDIMKNEQLARLLESVVIEGAGALHDGSHTDNFIEDVQSNDGILTEKDMKEYSATIRSPLIAREVLGYSIVGIPPPSSGGATFIGAARFLSCIQNEKKHGLRMTNKNHVLVEAMRHAFAIRMSISDPNFNRTVVKEAVNDLVYNDYIFSLCQMTKNDESLQFPSYGGEKWSKIKKNADEASQSAGTYSSLEGDGRKLVNNFGYLEDRGTSHFSVMDNQGNAVSITSSINNYFGSGILASRSGVLLNSQMDDFATPGRPNHFGMEPAESNMIEPGKKPLSSMSPTLIFHSRKDSTSLGEIFMALGASGGPKIISATLQTFLKHAIEKKDLFQSVIDPRIHDQLIYDSQASTLFESTIVQDFRLEVPAETLLELELTGHSLLPVPSIGCVQAISLNRITRLMTAVSDIRKGGKPAGV
jgi:gamma-glutamyltranspeptidase